MQERQLKGGQEHHDEIDQIMVNDAQFPCKTRSSPRSTSAVLATFLAAGKTLVDNIIAVF